MVLNLPADPSLADLQLAWESMYWGKASWRIACDRYECWMKYFGPDRKPRDIFRSDVAEYKEWLHKKGWKDNSINVEMHLGARFFRLLDELEVIEKAFNPFCGMAPRRIRLPK